MHCLYSARRWPRESYHFARKPLCQALLLCWPALAISQLDQPLKLQVDAHGVGVGEVLFQKESHAWFGQWGFTQRHFMHNRKGSMHWLGHCSISMFMSAEMFRLFIPIVSPWIFCIVSIIDWYVGCCIFSHVVWTSATSNTQRSCFDRCRVGSS